jgi:hypothetical protein
MRDLAALSMIISPHLLQGSHGNRTGRIQGIVYIAGTDLVWRANLSTPLHTREEVVIAA